MDNDIMLILAKVHVLQVIIRPPTIGNYTRTRKNPLMDNKFEGTTLAVINFDKTTATRMSFYCAKNPMALSPLEAMRLSRGMANKKI